MTTKESNAFLPESWNVGSFFSRAQNGSCNTTIERSLLQQRRTCNKTRSVAHFQVACHQALDIELQEMKSAVKTTQTHSNTMFLCLCKRLTAIYRLPIFQTVAFYIQGISRLKETRVDYVTLRSTESYTENVVVQVKETAISGNSPAKKKGHFGWGLERTTTDV